MRPRWLKPAMIVGAVWNSCNVANDLINPDYGVWSYGFAAGSLLCAVVCARIWWKMNKEAP